MRHVFCFARSSRDIKKYCCFSGCMRLGNVCMYVFVFVIPGSCFFPPLGSSSFFAPTGGLIGLAYDTFLVPTLHRSVPCRDDTVAVTPLRPLTSLATSCYPSSLSQDILYRTIPYRTMS